MRTNSELLDAVPTTEDGKSSGTKAVPGHSYVTLSDLTLKYGRFASKCGLLYLSEGKKQFYEISFSLCAPHFQLLN